MMKDFLKNIFLFFLPIIILLVVGILYLPKKNNDYLVKKAYLDTHSKEIETLILGSSHTYYDINPDFLDTKSFNAAYVSQSIDLDAAILFKYQNKWNRLKTIVIPIDYFTLYEQLGTSMESWRSKNYEIYWGIEQKSNKPIYWHQLDIQFDIFKDRFRRYISKESDTITCSSLGWGIIYDTTQKMDLVKEGKIAAARHLLGDTTCFSKNTKVLNTIISFAKENNTSIIFITTPAYKTYTNLLDSNQLNKTITAIQSIVAKESNCTYQNFLTNNDFSAADFHDADHLNKRGAMKFSLKIESLIKKANLKPIFLSNKIYK